MLVTIATLMGYSISMAVISNKVRTACNAKAASNINIKVNKLEKDHLPEDETAIAKKEVLKANVKYSLIVGGIGVAGALGSAAIIDTFDPIYDNSSTDSTPALEVENNEEGNSIMSIEVGDDITTVTLEDGTVIGSF